MSINAGLWTPSERRNTAMAARRAEAINRHLESETEEGQSPRYSKDFNRADEWQTEPSSATRLPKDFEPRVYPTTTNERNPEHTDWRRAIYILKKHWRLSTAFALAVTGTVTIATLLTKPVFEPEARVEVDPPGAEVFSLQGNNNRGTSADYIGTQAQNLQSDEVT